MDHEAALIQHLMQAFPQPVTGIGIGDDCAVTPLDHQHSTLISTDALVEGTHFQRNWFSPEQLAEKAFMVNASDIAAMGGTPHSLLLTLGLPAIGYDAWAERFLTALAALLKRFEIHLIGGDTVASKQQLLISMTILGRAVSSQIKYRHQAQAGDILAVTQNLGAAHAGLQLLTQKWHGTDNDAAVCRDRHLRPQAQLPEGCWLAQQSAVHAMIDLSDGLGSDIPKLCNASRLGACLELDLVAIEPAAARLAVLNQTRPIDIAYSGGEDYALLMAIAPDAFAALALAYQHHFHQPLRPIGHLTPHTGQLDWSFQQQAFEPQLTPFHHFE